ncbi:hypothetical protein [Bradyrhizobium sp. 170]|uniref:hypothetical protein n=1 Tax=Bradyrhizobium sp. 170 TaxID=2782641 RepID=UPI001FFEC1E1|nr:hypothetical protein [Bradyrhizobium sp. 170]UPK02016.1 hypothetical protein IVB05_30930 [Bradyrhizobium sp. 170]
MLSDKAPYIVTIVVAGLTWAATHLADRLLSTPIVKYSVQRIATKDSQTIYLTFKNITRDKTFKQLQLILTAPSDGVITTGAVIPVQPASEGDQPYQVAGRTFAFTFPEFQPGWQIEISADYTGSKEPSLRLSSPDQTVYAIKPSIETIIVEYHIQILAALAIFWIVALLVIWVIAARRKPVVRYD